MGKLIIIEGTDGSGKQTQTGLLYEKLCEIKGREKVKKISFPNYESKASEPVKMYLAGEFGKKADSVNAYAASVLFSVDRFASFKMEWEEFYNNGGVEKYLDWLVELEWNKIGIPEPDLVFFLDIPFDVSQKLMKDRRNKITGEKVKDIHEQDAEYLRNAYNIAKELAMKYKWNIVDCVENDKLRSIEEINGRMMEIILEKGI